MKKIIILLAVSLFGCGKKLDLKPNNTLVIPKTIAEFENLLDNTQVMNKTSALPQLSADEYYIPTLANFQSLFTPITRAAYIWQKDIFEGQSQIMDWTEPYAQVFYANSVLDELSKQDVGNDSEKKRIKGWALFIRSYAFYTLLSTFAKAYNSETATTDLGIPLKLNSAVTEIVQRNSVQQSYDQVVNDAIEASELLQQDIPALKRNRPSKVAAFALLARVFISMRKYDQAEIYVDKSMALYSKLINFNSLTIKTSSSFTYNSEETIYFSHNTNSAYSQTTYSTGALYGVEPTLLGLYSASDLRKAVYFRVNNNGNYAVSKGINSQINYPFTGLATDEMYLIKAECLARRNKIDESLSFLNALVKTRMSGTFIPITALNSEDLLNKVLIERRKALIWRCIRWTDLKRLNLEGRKITITRNLDGQIYTLEPNSPKYVLPIPADEIVLSGIKQNDR
ncbi:RagB/SusD family nutrient uptake outer membrane protein [Pedobacter alluvionis]|uniref:RagB/SusD family nutrient uptake outer membrane protein n=1 Tax=Pedobacter alluvionis TaxID=475253 RepID=A0A497Y5C1_9SPHI|nr:RagB/SusD family nutrient uptake outer membrane protein [Pedobacter alluvionis]RLJ77370.1 SusD-like starch-binding protein associating with outer membrane [Pedobacter alluvionis]TFB33411.1 RagB/SusD family nutrient uptake outer membrane protein [Pedobacter alluvionis]